MATKLVQKGRKKENRMGADGFVDCSQRGADLHRSKALSTAHPSGHRALPGDGGVCEVYDHSSSKGGGGGKSHERQQFQNDDEVRVGLHMCSS